MKVDLDVDVIVWLCLQEIEVTQRKIECETLYREIDEARTQCNRLVRTPLLIFLHPKNVNFSSLPSTTAEPVQAQYF